MVAYTITFLTPDRKRILTGWRHCVFDEENKVLKSGSGYRHT